MENFLRFGFEHCARLGYMIGFGAREGLLIYLSSLGGTAIAVSNIFNKKDSKKEDEKNKTLVNVKSCNYMKVGE